MLRKTLWYLDKGLTFFENWTLFLTVTAALVTLFVSVFTRYAMTYTMTWPEELVREVIVYSTFVGAAVAVKSRALIRVDALPNLVPGLKKILDTTAHLVLFVFGGFITWYGLKLVDLQWRTHQTTIILRVPQWILHSIIPLMGVLIMLRVIHVLYEDFTGKPISDK